MASRLPILGEAKHRYQMRTSHLFTFLLSREGMHVQVVYPDSWVRAKIGIRSFAESVVGLG